MAESITGKQRMEAALKGEKLDRHPVMLLLGGQFAERAGFTLEQFLTQPDAALETVKITCEELDSDALFVPGCSGGLQKADGKSPEHQEREPEREAPQMGGAPAPG